MNNTRKGAALITAIFLSVFVSALSMMVVKLSKIFVFDTEGLMDKLRCRLEVESVMAKIEYLGMTSVFEGKYMINNQLSNFPRIVPLNGQVFRVGNVTVEIKDKSSLIPVDFATRMMWRKAFSFENLTVKDADICYDSFLDWKDRDDLKRLNGAERYYYRVEKGYEYSPRNLNFLADLGEFYLIRGFLKKGVMDGVFKNFFGFSDRTWRLNYNLASSNVLATFFNLSDYQKAQIDWLKKEKNNLKNIDLSNVGVDVYRYVEMLSDNPSRYLDCFLSCKIGNAVEKVYFSVDFKNKKGCAVVKKYKE